MKNVFKFVTAGILAMGWSSNMFAVQLAQDSAQVSLQVGRYARISLLDDFALQTSGTDGDANAIYSGSDQFRLEANCPVIVTVAGGNLSNGSQSIPTSYQLDNGDNFETTGRHNGMHVVAAQAQLGNISDQEAGAYAADITITVSTL